MNPLQKFFNVRTIFGIENNPFKNSLPFIEKFDLILTEDIELYIKGLDPIKLNKKSLKVQQRKDLIKNVYLKSEYLVEGLTILKKLTNPFILVIGEGDFDSKVFDKELIVLLEKYMCKKIYMVHSDTNHPKIEPLPIGFRPHNLILNYNLINNTFNNTINYENKINRIMINFTKKKIHNLKDTNHRINLINESKKYKIFDYIGMISLKNYYKELQKYRFVMSPWGNGYDCWRNFEILLNGAIPVIPKCHYVCAYEKHNIPYVIFENLDELTEKRLNLEWNKNLNKLKNVKNKLLMKYWIDYILN